MMDTGTSSGEIIGHSKAVNAVSIRQQRPFRAATAGDDGSIIFHQDVRYDNTGDRFASVGSDSKIFLYDGKTGDTLGEITDSPHKGSIVSVLNLPLLCMKLTGPQKSVTSITPSKDSGTFLAGSTDGRILSFSTATSESDSVDGEGHTNLVSGLATSPDGTVYSIAYDDKVKEIMATGQSFTDASATLNSQPRSVAVSSDSTVFVTEINSIEAFRSNQKIDTHQPKYSPHAVAASGDLVAIGGDDQNVHLYEWDGKALKETSVLDGNKGTVSALAFSPDSKYIASGDLVTSRWSFHSARVNSLSWTSDSRHCASGSLDTHVYVWSVERPMKNIAVKNAGPGGVNVVLWTSEDAKTGKLVSGGADGCLRVWEVTFHA
ncbi:WD40 repeat protein [Salix suchowensis]|nr:WD40 repeat protein [Salix suchowensis]